MLIRARIGALTPLSTLAASVTTSSTEAIYGDSLAAAASVYTPTYAAGTEGADNADVVHSDTPGDGLVGFMRFSDGVVRPVRIRIAEANESAFLSIAGSIAVAPEVEFDNAAEGGWIGPTGYFYADVEGYCENSTYFNGNDGGYAGGYHGQQIASEDLLADVVTFSGGGEMERDSVDANINLAFYDHGTYVGGGAAGTINGQTLGGAYTGSEDDAPSEEEFLGGPFKTHQADGTNHTA